MKLINTKLHKLCSARPGDAIRLLDAAGAELPDTYIIAVMEQKGRRAMRPNRTEGLYDEERPLFMVNLETGQAEALPHLSSRVQILQYAVVEVKS